MQREICNKLLIWKENDRNALLITGARQTGKTYIIRQFAEQHFLSFIEINFLENKEAVKLF